MTLKLSFAKFRFSFISHAMLFYFDVFLILNVSLWLWRIALGSEDLLFKFKEKALSHQSATSISDPCTLWRIKSPVTCSTITTESISHLSLATSRGYADVFIFYLIYQLFNWYEWYQTTLWSLNMNKGEPSFNHKKHILNFHIVCYIQSL
jgi:hypothetical protein